MDNDLFERAKKQAARCNLLANPRRVLILWLLSKGELPVREIAVRSNSSMQNISQHLGLLKRSGLVQSRRAGQTIFYQIADDEFVRHCPAMLNAPEDLL